MIISVASGKGGTGKTIVATGLALSLGSKIQFLDCDVEEPDAHLFLNPQLTKSQKIFLPKPVVDEKKCDYCGRCSEVCQYNAIAVVHPVRSPTTGDNPSGKNNEGFSAKDKTSNGVKNKVLVFSELCHSCGACKIACPQKAISEVDVEKGVVEEGGTLYQSGAGQAGNIEFVQGKLKECESSPLPLVKAVKGKTSNDGIVIIDSSPGTSCPVVEAVKNTDFCLLVTEPTPFGLNDLILAVEMCRKIEVPSGVIINREDIGDKKVEEYCKRENIPVLMRIPFEKEIAYAYSKGIPLVKARPEYKEKFQKLFETVQKMIL